MVSEQRNVLPIHHHQRCEFFSQAFKDGLQVFITKIKTFLQAIFSLINQGLMVIFRNLAPTRVHTTVIVVLVWFFLDNFIPNNLEIVWLSIPYTIRYDVCSIAERLGFDNCCDLADFKDEMAYISQHRIEILLVLASKGLLLCSIFISIAKHYTNGVNQVARDGQMQVLRNDMQAAQVEAREEVPSENQVAQVETQEELWNENRDAQVEAQEELWNENQVAQVEAQEEVPSKNQILLARNVAQKREKPVLSLEMGILTCQLSDRRLSDSPSQSLARSCLGSIREASSKEE